MFQFMKTQKQKIAYKILLSIILGLISFFGIFYSLRIDYGGFSINFAFSLILPMLITLAWGYRYGLLSITAGLVFLYPFILGPYNGWASIVPSLALFLWIGIHGYGSESRRNQSKLTNNLYILQLIYIIIRIFLYALIFPLLISVNPPFWNPLAYSKVGMDVIMLFAVKGIIVDSILLAICDVLLQLPFVRNIFLLRVSKGAKTNTPILAGMVGFGMIFTIVIMFFNNFLINKTDPYSWLLKPEEPTQVTFIMSFLLFTIMGGIAVRFLQKNLETQISLEKRNRQYLNVIKKIRSLNEELEERVLIRTAELKSAVEELEEFSYAISHDLKSPVRAIDGYTSIILEDSGERLNEEDVKMIGSIRAICSNMIELINKLLEYSVMSKKKLNKTMLEVDVIVREVFEEYKIGTQKRDISLEIKGVLPGVYVDKVLFKEAITNLIGNSFKFTRDKENALIIISSREFKSEYEFALWDNGVGFDMKYAGKLFNIFQRLHNNSQYEGSGIGLAIVKKIITNHGGKVWIESITGEGTTVYFTLPKKIE